MKELIDDEAAGQRGIKVKGLPAAAKKMSAAFWTNTRPRRAKGEHPAATPEDNEKTTNSAQQRAWLAAGYEVGIERRSDELTIVFTAKDGRAQWHPHRRQLRNGETFSRVTPLE